MASVCAYLGMILFFGGGLGLLYAMAYSKGISNQAAGVLFDTLKGICLGYALLFAAACLALATWFIHRQGAVVSVPYRDVVYDPAALEARRKRFPYYLIDPLRQRAPIGDRQNPILVRELRWGITPRATRAIRTFYVSTFFLGMAGLLLAWPVPLLPLNNFDDSIAVFAAIQIGLVLLLGPLLMAPGFAKEHERGNIDMLRTTLLAPYQILDGKLAAGLIELAPLLLAMGISGCLVFLLVAVSGHSVGTIVACYPTLAVALWVSLCAGLFASLMTRRTGVAIILSYGAMLLLLGGAVGVAVIIDMTTSGQGRFPDFLWFLSPVTAYGYCVVNAAWLSVAAVLGWLVSLVVFFLIGCMLRDASVLYFNHRCMYDR